jgi:hypothetical protein
MEPRETRCGLHLSSSGCGPVEDFYEDVNDPSSFIKFRNLMSTQVLAYLPMVLYHAANMMLYMNHIVNL